MDTFATLCHLLGLPPDGPIDGKPIVQAIEEGDLLQDARVGGECRMMNAECRMDVEADQQP
jgi:hypothetical protein